MHYSKMITTIDAHAAGEPLRIITSGFPPVKGSTILDKRRYVLEHYDHLRKFLMLEPRGHSGMYGCLVTPPVTEDGDFGVLFMHNEGYSTMCGHGVIAITKVAVETGMVLAQEGEQTVKIDSPAGRVTAKALVEGGRVKNISFANVPSFVLTEKLMIPVEGIGEVAVDIAFGGAFYAFVEARDLRTKIIPEKMDELVRLGMEIKYKVMDRMEVRHPLEPELCGIYGTIITDPVVREGKQLISKNVTIFADGQIDRSPTGTGTSARIPLLMSKGIMDESLELINYSVIDTVFYGRIEKTVQIGPFPGVIPIISGNAQIMGFNRLVLEPEDPLPEGFRITGG
ncbi:MAG: proline racemase family protein [Bacillota bacterium]